MSNPASLTHLDRLVKRFGKRQISSAKLDLPNGYCLLILRGFRSEFLTGHGLKIISSIAFIYYFNPEHSLNYIFHSYDTAHTAIFIGYY